MRANRSLVPVAGAYLPGLLAALLLTAGLTIPLDALAQDGPRCEIGTSLGLTVINTSGGGDSDMHFGIPAGIGPLAPFAPAVYVSIFAAPSLILEPQVSISVLSSGSSTNTFLSLVGQVGYLFTPDGASSPYLAVNGAIQNLSGDGSSLNGTGLGGEAGYRFRLGESAAVRLKAHYRRWFFDFDRTNEFGVAVGFGAVI